MGGAGSGRTWGHGRTTVESLRSIDVRELRRAGILQEGARFTCTWTDDAGETTASIGGRFETGRLTLEYRHRCGSSDWQDVTEEVSVESTRCNFGGTRPWFICPGAGCGQRVAKLYLDGPYMLCRHCYRLAYASQREDSWGRACARARKIRQRLGGSGDLTNPFPQKPPRMHWRTYERLRQAELRINVAAAAELRELLSRLT